MAKRKRLSAFGMVSEEQPEPASTQPVPPVARVAADAATRAALDALADEMRMAKDTGRMLVDLPLGAVDMGHLHRDRMQMDAEDMAALKASIAARGQQTPIEVVAQPDGRYGLISGARRLTALQALADETGDDARFGKVRALLRPFDSAPEAYLAMVEENEIRADLSFYERGRLAYEAARIGVFDSPAAAVKALFVHAPAPKRSKILNFVALHQAIGATLRFPEAIPEKLGLALVKAIEQDKTLAARLARSLQAASPSDATEERAILDAALMPPKSAGERKLVATETSLKIKPGLQIKGRAGKVVLTGADVTDDLLNDLAQWLKTRG